ncbi:MAG: 3-oxoacyl-[Lachnospiraceae bacterium]|nr:3-oxoacyl-[acyl-carrier-protein] reductase [Lachnospiraceae bacterium]
MLQGKTAVVTGGSRGIGRAIALAFAEQGAEVAIVATKCSEAAEAVIAELVAKGSNARLYACDVSDPEAVTRVMAQILTDYGHVDILVNNAGITRDNLLPGLGESDIDDVIDVNLKGTIRVTRAFIRAMAKQRSGVILNISSVVGLMGNSGQTNYAASKAGVIGFTKSVAKEYGRRNIRCNAIAPGYIATEMTAALGAEKSEEIAKQLPLGRLGRPEDVAALALFLASDAASYITGEVISVDGGMYI